MSAPSLTHKDSGFSDEISALVDRAKAGDREALEELLETMRPRAMAAALKVLRNQEDAEDAVQEAFVKVWRCLRRFEGRSSVSTWVHRVVTNASLDLLRRNGKSSAMSDGQPSDMPAHAECEDHQTPETVLASNEVRQLVRKAIAELPDAHREAIELRDLEDCSYLEISKMARCPLGTVMSRLHHARHKLANDLRAPLGDAVQRYAA